MPAPTDYTHPPFVYGQVWNAWERAPGRIAFRNLDPPRVERAYITAFFRGDLPYLTIAIDDGPLCARLSRFTTIALEECEFLRVEHGKFTAEGTGFSKAAMRWANLMKKEEIQPPSRKWKGQTYQKRNQFMTIEIRGLLQEKLEWYGSKLEDMSAPARDIITFLSQDANAAVLEVLLVADSAKKFCNLELFAETCNEINEEKNGHEWPAVTKWPTLQEARAFNDPKNQPPTRNYIESETTEEFWAKITAGRAEKEFKADKEAVLDVMKRCEAETDKWAEGVVDDWAVKKLAEYGMKVFTDLRTKAKEKLRQNNRGWDVDEHPPADKPKGQDEPYKPAGNGHQST